MERETKINIVKIVLGLAAAGGILTVAAVAPNALKAVDLFYDRKKKEYDKYKKKYYIKTVVNRMENRGLIEFYNKGEGSYIRLTNKGRNELLKYQSRDKTIEKPKKWDKKWRVVIFDIAEVARNFREGLRKELVNLGFVKLQNSVWVYPYECAEVVAMIKTYFKIESEVLYMTVEQIENDGWLKEEFELV